ncbi:hypothetical protein CBL_07072 [Carabus blaptoides fortunei]
MLDTILKLKIQTIIVDIYYLLGSQTTPSDKLKQSLTDCKLSKAIETIYPKIYNQKEWKKITLRRECTEHYTEPYHAAGYIYPDYEYEVPIDLDYVPPEYAALDKYPFAAEKISKKELSIEVDNDSRIHWEDNLTNQWHHILYRYQKVMCLLHVDQQKLRNLQRKRRKVVNGSVPVVVEVKTMTTMTNFPVHENKNRLYS